MTYSSKLKRGRGFAASPGSGGKSARGKGGSSSAKLVLAFMALLVGAGAWRWLQGRNQPLPTTLSLTVLAGEATVARADAGVDAPLRAGQTATLQRGDALQTTADARAKLTLSGGETLELHGQTHISVLELYQTPMSRAPVAVFALHEGKTLARIRHALFQGMRFEIEMNTATIKAREDPQDAHGAAFQCDALANDHAYVLVYDGAVEVSMGEQALTVQAGQAVDIWLGQTLAPIDTGQVLPGGPPEATVMPLDGTPTLTELEKTLFPSVLTPTRPGDLAPTPQSGELYTVQAGDTLYSIARKFGVSWEDVWNANKDILPKPELIRVGQQLRIPK